jgi:hypothetical protein
MTWKKEVVEHFFNHLDSEAILQIPLSMSLQKDGWAWHYERNGLFSVRSTYRMMIEAKKSREDYFEGREAALIMEKSRKNGNSCGI